MGRDVVVRTGRDVVVWIGRGVVVALDDALGADPPPPQLARTITHTSPLQTVRILMDTPPLPSRSRARILPDRAHSGERIAAVRARVVIVGWGGIEPPRRVARPGYNRVGSPPAQPPRRVSTRRSAPTVSERWDIGERSPHAYGTDSRLPRSSIFETHGAPISSSVPLARDVEALLHPERFASGAFPGAG